MKQQTINIEDALSKASTNIDSLDARLLLEFVKGVDGNYLFTHRDEKINIKESKLFFDLVQERKKKRLEELEKRRKEIEEKRNKIKNN